MKDLSSKIISLSNDCEDDVEFAKRMIEEIIKPMVSDAFRSGKLHVLEAFGKNHAEFTNLEGYMKKTFEI